MTIETASRQGAKAKNPLCCLIIFPLFLGSKLCYELFCLFTIYDEREDSCSSETPMVKNKSSKVRAPKLPILSWTIGNELWL